MGLFDSPRVNIRKRLPEDALLLFIAIETFVEMELSDLEQRQLDYALGLILGVWVRHNSAAGAFGLSSYNARYIGNLANNCANRLTEHSFSRTTNVIDKLIAQGNMPGMTRKV